MVAARFGSDVVPAAYVAAACDHIADTELSEAVQTRSLILQSAKRDTL
jgi:hypothetical protein